MRSAARCVLLLLALLPASCRALQPGFEEPDLLDPKGWPDLSAHARPVILRQPGQPDQDLLDWQKSVQEREQKESDRIAGQPKVTATFVDLPLRDALAEISDQAKIPIVVDQTVSGNATLNIRDVPFETALRLILFTGSYSYTTDGFAYYVGTVDPTNANYAVLTSTRIIPTNRPPKEIVQSLPKSYASYLSFTDSAHSLTMTGPTPVLDRIEADVRQLDRPPVQIQIEVLVVETKAGSDYDAGLDYSRFEATLQQTMRNDNNPGTRSVDQTDVLGRLTAAFGLLEGQNLASIRSHPKVVTSDGTPAEIRSIVENYVSIQRTGVVITSEIKVIQSGTTLKVTPRVTRNDEIELTLEPEVADVVGINAESSGSLPVISRRGTKSTVRVKNGDVIAIGGLYEETIRQMARGIPVLKDVPVLNLFTARTEDRGSDRELLIFVSPKVIR